MCGILGFQGSFDPNLLDNGLQIQSHRGPDDSGSYFDKNSDLGLAHNRLSIIDLSKNGQQPMKAMGRDVYITFNGEIYNYLELKSELLGRGYSFKSQTDTEVLLNLYLEFGLDMLSKLNGIFSFGLWDDHKKILIVTRDRFGVKPLYYFQNEKGVAFASELKTLLLFPGVDKDINPKAVYSHLNFLWSPTPMTMIKGIEKLEPGNYLIIKDGRITQKKNFFEYSFSNPKEQRDESDWVNSIRESFSKAVSRQMVSDVRVGSFLSGGLDSSAIVYEASRINQDLPCFTMKSEPGTNAFDGFSDDLPYARMAAASFGVNLSEVEIKNDFYSDLEKMVYLLDEPCADPAALNVYYICKQARNEGVKVLLSGSGGDDLFTGYRRHQALTFEKYWSFLPKILRKGLKRGSSLFSNSSSFFRRLERLFRFSDLEGDDRLTSYFYWLPNLWPSKLINREFWNINTSIERFNPLLENLQRWSNPSQDQLERMLFLEMKHFLTDHNLNYTDKMGMACGVEIRVPFLDNDLVNLSNKIPTSLKQKGRVSKYILKKSMEHQLPHEIIYRSKSGFGAPLRQWLNKELREVMLDLLSERRLKNRGILNPSEVQNLIKLNEQGKIDASYPLFAMMCMEWWFQLFLDQKNEASFSRPI